jgi:hypothetical protein
LNFHFYGADSPIYESSIVDIYDGRFAFALVERDEIARYNVTRWDDEKVYCRFSASRPFTILETVTDTPGSFSPKFVKNGKLYCHDYDALMVFDIRSSRRIRKLGHFVRMDYRIRDMAVSEDGNILLCMSHQNKWYLNLLKNPE